MRLQALTCIGEVTNVDEALAHRLVGLTRDFYVRNVGSFSETRCAPWSGWHRVLEEVDLIGKAGRGTYRMADIGCGNLRFERMVVERLESADRRVGASSELDIICVDDNADFLSEADALLERTPSNVSIEVIRTDIVEDAISRTSSALSSIIGCDLVVCFAVMHHIPLALWREELFDHLVDMAAPGGYIALSFWCFSRDERLVAKAEAATDAAEGKLGVRLDRSAGDYLMGWQDEQDSWRYCHDFTDDDIKKMIEDRVRRCGDIVEVARFSADGKRGDLNEYVIVQRR